MIPLLSIEHDLDESDEVFRGCFFNTHDARACAQAMSKAPLSWMRLEEGSEWFVRFLAHGETPVDIWRAPFGRGSLIILDYGV